MESTKMISEVVTSILINAFDASEDDARKAADLVILTCLNLLLGISQGKARAEFEELADYFTNKEVNDDGI